jgi:hypothetical protein
MKKFRSILCLPVIAALAFAGCSLGGDDDDVLPPPFISDNPLAGSMTKATADKIFDYSPVADGVSIDKFKDAAELENYLNGGAKALANPKFIIATINGRPVVKIADKAFDESEAPSLPAGLSAIKLPETLKEIGSNVFANITVTIELHIPAVVLKILTDTDPAVLVELDAAATIKEVTAEDSEGESTPPPVIPAGTFYRVTVDNGITGGTLAASPKSAEAGEEITLTAVHEAGYRLKAGSFQVVKTGDSGTVVPPGSASGNIYVFTLPGYDVTASAEFESSPGQINSAEDLAKIGNDPDPAWSLDGNYELAADITLTNWMPIGAAAQQPFTGRFRGNGKTITLNGFNPAALAISVSGDFGPDMSQATFLGLFRSSGGGAIIENFALVLNLGAEGSPVDLSSVATLFAGGVTGWAEQTALRNITLSGTFIASSAEDLWIGGIAGCVLDSGTPISGCNSSLKIEAVSDTGEASAGGIAAGFCSEGAGIENCHITGDISSAGAGEYNETGGIAGHLEASVINCSVTGNISAEGTSGRTSAGGIAGSFSGEGSDGSIINSFVTGDISASATTGRPQAGGIAGYIYCESGRGVTLRSSYATGNVSAAATGTTGTEEIRAGGLIGGSGHEGGDVIIENCYAAGNVAAAGSGTNIFAGGILGLHNIQYSGTYTVRACAALNQEISSTYTIIGRVAGASFSGTLENNIANGAMTLNGSAATGGAGGNKDGADVTLPPAQTDYAGWDFVNTWEMGAGGYPVLRWQE